MNYCKASFEDLKELVWAEEDAFPGFGQSLVMLAPMVDMGNVRILRNQKKQWLAYALLLPSVLNRSQIQIFSFGVSSKVRKQGIGKIFLKSLLEDLRLSYSEVNLYCNPENAAAIALYSNAGFVKREFYENFYGLNSHRHKYHLRF